MRAAWGVTCSIPVEGNCNKRCPYCITGMTGCVKPNPALVDRNLPKVLHRADMMLAHTMIATAKNEPLLNMEALLKCLRVFENYTEELQTNGICLHGDPNLLKVLFEHGLNWVAFSIDSLEQLEKYKDLFAEVVGNNMSNRACVNLTDSIPLEVGFFDLFEMIKEIGNINQLLIRNISIPEGVTSGSQHDWIKEHVDFRRYLKWAKSFRGFARKKGHKPVDVLPFNGGVEVWSVDGITIVFSDYCLQESKVGDVGIRNLVYLENGELWDGWSKQATKIF